MNKYEHYKKVDLPWLEEVPVHWESIPLSRLLETKNLRQKNVAEQRQLLSVTREFGVIVRDLTEQSQNHNTISEDLSNYKVVEKGDFVMNKMKSWQGSYGISSLDGIVSPAYFVFNMTTNNSLNQDFFHKAIRSKCYVNEFARYSKGIRTDQWDFPITALREVQFYFPPLAEQEQIAAYLDWKINEIDWLIALEQEKIIELQSVKRKALIDLIQGHGNNIRKNKSDNEIPEVSFIPIDADLVPLFSLVRENKEKNGGRITNLLSLSYGNIIRKSITSSKGLLPENFNSYQIVHEDMVILRLTDLQNDQVSLRTGYVRETGIITSAYVGLIPNTRKVLGEYLQLLLHSYDILKVFYRLGTGLRQSLGYKDLKRLPIILPPIEQQRKLVNKVQSINNSIDKEIENSNKKIETLKSLKNSLISEVVTGKIDVRNVVIPSYEKVAVSVSTDEEEIEE